MPETEPGGGTEVTARSLDDPSDVRTHVIRDDYCLVTEGACYVDGIEAYPLTGTHVITVRNVRGRSPAAPAEPAAVSPPGTAVTGPGPAKLWDKYLVVRRDGTVPHWPYFVIAAADPAAPAALDAYADAAEAAGMDAGYVADIRGQARDFDRWRAEHGAGDPDAPRHRTDDPAVVARIRAGSRRVYPEGS